MRERLAATIDGPMYSRPMVVLSVVSLVPLAFKDPPLAIRIAEYACVAVFVCDYLLRWAVADYKLGKGALSFLVYPITPMAIIDLLSILPTFVALNPAWRSLRVLRLMRALRAFRALRYSKSFGLLVEVLTERKSELAAVLAFAFAYIVMSALVLYNVEPDTFDTFYDAIYWAVVSLTTVGYGDIFPTTDVGRFIAMVSSFMGIAVVALPSGIITAGFVDKMHGDGAQ